MTATASIGTLARPQMPPRPPAASGVRRPRLVTPLCEHGEANVVALVAPAGYGKTTVLREWASRDSRPFAWVTLDARDDEPMRLTSRVTRAVELARASDPGGPFVLVLDDVHAVRRPAALDVLNAVATDLPPEAMLAIASRTEPPLPLARLRAERALIELRAGELALQPGEIAAVARRAGVAAGADDLASLVHLTEGWPAGVALALLAADESPRIFGGDESVLTDYLRQELLAALPQGQREFLRRACVLDVLTGPACDAVLGRSGSAAVLADLAQANVLLVALDRRGERFRPHRLLAATLRGELRQVEPELERELHRRAFAWHRRAGDLDGALGHALAAGDVAAGAALVWSQAAAEVSHGRAARLDRWLERFTPRQVAVHPSLALATATRELAAGHGDLAEHWITVAAVAAGPEPAAPVAAAIAALHAAGAHHGLAEAGRDADRAAALLPGDGPCRAVCCFTAGVAAHLTGDREQALLELAEGVRHAAVTAPSLHALCLAQLAVLAVDDDDWEGAARLVTRARAQVDRFALHDDAGSALVFAVSALVRARRGRIEEAQHDLRAAARLAATLTDFAPWYEAELAILGARAALRLSDAAEAAIWVDAARRLLRLAPEAVVLAGWLDATREQLAAFSSRRGVELASLTTAELRILRYLPTHLCFREIAERICVSANTVKTQANSVYRKLDVSCRSEAVSCAGELGLLEAD
jgi:LuxR family maltose regulon positive regulatory protein